MTKSLSVRRKWFIFIPLIRLTQETRWWGWYISLPRKGCTIGNVKLGRWGGGSPKKKKNLALWLLLKKNIIPFQNALPPSPLTFLMVHPKVRFQQAPGFYVVSELQPWYKPSLKQLIGGGQLIADINTNNLQKVNLTSARLQCVRVCVNFPHTVVFCWLFEFFLYFVQNIGRNGRTFTHINEPLRWANQAWMCQGSAIIIEITGDFGVAQWPKSSFRYLKRRIL